MCPSQSSRPHAVLLTLKNIKLDLKEVFTTTAVSQQSSVLPICFFKALTDMALLTAVAGFYFTIFFFSHLQRKDSESTAKNPMTVAYYLLLFAITLKNIVRAAQITAIRSPVLLLCFSNLRFRPAVNMRMALVRRVLNMSIPLQTFSHPLL